ncbi:MAG: LPS export ABC transporter permease LptG [Gammaproteobacteria bacterium]|nr:LPS export ABC transporter permease LptG [Gammaproteobacteria bacterium]
MTVVENYLMRQIGLGLLIAAALLLPLFSFFDLIDQMEHIGEGLFRMRDAFYIVLLLLPRRLIQLLPFIALIGNVIALGRLALNSEIIAMRAAGLSPARISLASFKVGLCLLLLLGALEQYGAPYLQKKAISHRLEVLNQSGELGADLGIWTRDQNRIMRLGEAIQATLVQDVEIFTLDEQGLLDEYIYAQDAEIINNDLWRLHNVAIKEFNGAHIDTRSLARMSWRPFLSAAQIDKLTRPLESLSPEELYHYIEYLKEAGQQYDEISLAFWRKFGAGLIMLAMLLLSVPFVFGSIRTGIGARLALAGITGICVYLLDQIFSNAGLLLNLHHALVALTPGLLLVLIGVFWLQRVA